MSRLLPQGPAPLLSQRPLARHRLAEFPHRQKQRARRCFDEGTSGTSTFRISIGIPPLRPRFLVHHSPNTPPQHRIRTQHRTQSLPRSFSWIPWPGVIFPRELTASGSTPPLPGAPRLQRALAAVPVLRRRLAVASRRGERQTRHPVHVGLAREPQPRRPHPRGGQSHHPFPPQGAIW